MVRYQKELLKDCWDEFFALANLHWQETEMYRHGQQLNPDKQAYIEYNTNGYHQLYTIRDDGKMVGNCGMYITTSMHTGIKMAHEDTLFLHPDYRKGGIAYRFMKFVEKDLIDTFKVAEITSTVKLAKSNSSRLMEALGYEFVAKEYSKQIPENMNV